MATTGPVRARRSRIHRTPEEFQIHIANLREEEQRLLEARIGAAISLIKTARSNLLKTYCGVNGNCPGEFNYLCNIEEVAEDMIERYGHKKGLHDNRPVHYAKTIYVDIFNHIISSAHKTFQSMSVSQRCSYYGTCLLKLEMLHAFLNGRYRGKKRSRASDIVSVRVFTNVSRPKASPLAKMVSKELQTLATNVGMDVSLTSKEDVIEVITQLKMKYLTSFCQTLNSDEDSSLSHSDDSPTGSRTSTSSMSTPSNLPPLMHHSNQSSGFLLLPMHETGQRGSNGPNTVNGYNMNVNELLHQMRQLQEENRRLKEENEYMKSFINYTGGNSQASLEAPKATFCEPMIREEAFCGYGSVTNAPYPSLPRSTSHDYMFADSFADVDMKDVTRT